MGTNYMGAARSVCVGWIMNLESILSILAFSEFWPFEPARYKAKRTKLCSVPKVQCDILQSKYGLVGRPTRTDIWKYVNKWLLIVLIICGYCNFVASFYLRMSGFVVTDVYMASHLRLSVGQGLTAYDSNCVAMRVVFFATDGSNVAFRGILCRCMVSYLLSRELPFSAVDSGKDFRAITTICGFVAYARQY